MKVIIEGKLGLWVNSNEKLALYNNEGILILNNIILSEAYERNWLPNGKQVKITIEEV